MKCPICGNKDLEINKVTGFSSGIEKECLNCGCVWLKEKKEGFIILSEGVK